MTGHFNPEPVEATQTRFVQIDSALLNRLLDLKLSAAEWSLYMYLIDLDPFGDRPVELPKPTDIMVRLGIKKTAFYSAIAKFRKLGLYEVEATRIYGRNLHGSRAESYKSSRSENSPKNRKQSATANKDSAKTENHSAKTESNSAVAENQFAKTESKFVTAETRSPEVLSSMDSGSSHKDHNIHTFSHKKNIFSYPLALGSLDEPATADDKKMMAEWVRENYKEWINLAIATRLIKDVGIVYPNNLKRPYFKALEANKLIDIEKAINEVSLEKLQRWLEEDKKNAQAMDN